MKGPLLTAALALATLGAAAPLPEADRSEADRWRATAARVQITRDDWGVAHVHGASDADAVFGTIYAQAEDDFPRVEANYLTALGRTAEAEGEAAIWTDLRQRLFVDPVRLQADYRRSPPWLRALMDAWADGLNFYLATHPDEHPRVLTRFEPWMALSFTEGSIGGDIERVDLAKLAAFYNTPAPQLALDAEARRQGEPKGSNGIAIGPKLSASGHPLLLINPHTSFFFRSELEMRSDAGLHAYGASTWGQFFIYQGWNERVGWMHTSSGVDAVDEFAETVTRRGPDLITYRHGRRDRPLDVQGVTLRFRKSDGGMGERRFVTWRTHHGPVVRKDGTKWISIALMNKPIPALRQSWLRTKARDYTAFMAAAALQANSSNNTVYADADGHTALLYPQFVPQRESRFDWRKPVDGSDPAADWRGLTPLSGLPSVRDPAGGWLYNSNDAPWRAAGEYSPRRIRYPAYMDQAGGNARGDHATALLARVSAVTPERLRAIAYDPAMPLFDMVTPKALTAWDAQPDGAQKRRLADAIALLRGWDRRWSADSKATTLANYWGERLWARGVRLADAPARSATDAIYALPGDALLEDLASAQVDRRAAWGRPHVPWGEVNRFQRNDAGIVQRFDDAKPSIPVPFVSARWGSLASFGAKPYPGTRRWYGTSGNSFVAIVEFGPRVRAWAVTAGGESGHPASRHFTDQAKRYAAGDLRPVYFWPEDLNGHVERSYRPGESK